MADVMEGVEERLVVEVMHIIHVVHHAARQQRPAVPHGVRPVIGQAHHEQPVHQLLAAEDAPHAPQSPPPVPHDVPAALVHVVARELEASLAVGHGQLGQGGQVHGGVTVA